MAPVASTMRDRAQNAAAARHSSRAYALLRPAARAYMIGYLLDALPTLFKQLFRFILVSIRNVAKVRKRIKAEKAAARTEAPKTEAESVQSKDEEYSQGTFRIEVPAPTPTTLYNDAFVPALRQVPDLLKAIIKALATALGPKGVGAACALAMGGTALLDIAVMDSFARTAFLKNATEMRQRRLAAISTLGSAAIASSTALFMLQRASVGADHGAIKTNLTIGNPFRRKNVSEAISNRSVPTPLAPGGHFLARLTTLSIPPTPQAEKGSRSPALPKRGLTASPSEGNDVAASDAEELGTASPTIDLSLFALVRAMDTLARAVPFFLVGEKTLGVRNTAIGPAGGMKTDTVRNQLARAQFEVQRSALRRMMERMASTVQDQAHGLTFVVACAVIMFNWFYHPERLPPSYVRWISNLASMDHRCLEALRCLRHQKPFRYEYGDRAMDPSSVNILGSLSESLGHPYAWGDLGRLPVDRSDARQQRQKGSKDAIAAAKAKDQPLPEPFILEGAVGPRGRGEMGGVPCEVIHCGVGGGNCYKNALYRFFRAWRMCLGIYVPVHLLPRLIFGPKQFKTQPVETIIRVLVGSARSATFLSTYIASIWFMVCIGRSILLPRLFPNVSFRFWDRGLGPIMGSWTCGWSVFIEEPRKRAEMALYVAPRALFALAEMGRPGWLSKGKKSALQAERILFGMSVGIVVAAARHRPDLLRGITALMAWVVAPVQPAVGARRVKAAAPRS